MVSEILLDGDQLRLLPASEVRNIPWEELRLWLHHRAIYCIPTVELVDFLRGEIGDKKAIEIGSGCGFLGRALNIPMTDSKLQTTPEVAFYYRMMGQPLVEYPEDVEKLEALEAIEKYKPDVVIGSWITRWIDPGLEPPAGGGSIWGVKEDRLIGMVGKYIHIGSDAIHGYKLALKPQKIIKENWIVSRSDRNDNVIYIWEK